MNLTMMYLTVAIAMNTLANSCVSCSYRLTLIKFSIYFSTEYIFN